MSTTRRKFTREFKLAAVKRLQSGYPVGRVARELEVNPTRCMPGGGRSSFYAEHLKRTRSCSACHSPSVSQSSVGGDCA